MRKVSIGPASKFEDPGRIVVDVDGVEVGIFKLRGQFTAYLNRCPHYGGPVCQGLVIARVEEQIAEDKRSLGMHFSKTQTNIVCPWHGFEFDIATGKHQGDSSIKLRSVAVAVENGEVVVTLPDRGSRCASDKSPGA